MKYQKPWAEIVEFENDDIITNSNCITTGKPCEGIIYKNHNHGECPWENVSVFDPGVGEDDCQNSPGAGW